MPWRRTFYGVATALGAAVLAWGALQLLLRVRTTLTVLVLGATLATIFAPLADRLQAAVGRRGLAVLVLLLAGLLLTAGAALAVLGPLVADMSALVQRLPAYVERLDEAVDRLQAWLEARGVRVEAEEALRSSLRNAQGQVARLLAGALQVAGAVGTLLSTLVLSLVVAIYLLLDGPRLYRRTLGYLPPAWHGTAEEVAALAARVVGGYLRGQLLLALLIGTAAGAGSALLGLPYPALIGVAAGLFELVPTVGAVLGAIPALVLAAFESPRLLLYTAAFFAALQQLEGLVLVPRITGRSVGLHPLAALLALTAGFELGGIAGAVLAVPAVALAWALFQSRRARAPADAPAEGAGSPAQPT